MKTDYEYLQVQVDEAGIADVVLNRPEKRNALTRRMQVDFDQILMEAMLEDEIKVVMLRGAGKVFSAGADLIEAGQSYLDTGNYVEKDPNAPPHLRRAWYFTKPLIAGVHGYVGPRATMILGNFDFLIAAEGTKFSFEHSREAARGVGGEPFHLQVPMRVLKKLIMMGGWFDAEQALDLHIVQRVVPVDEVAAETRRWAEELAKIPTEHFQVAKMSIHRMYELMGLLNMKAVQNLEVGHPPTKENQAWWAEAVEGGLTKALPSRDGGFDDDIARL
ncbi:MAG TPA: enoyl-CoA hydratase/isomerase family protein [Chloroflexota bacterium]|jgi:enoyl-CoA hydratase/carnithine racemase|nr:enoyl-CoA hydratase/isomerase family protein [Chloroflexota bacterium]